MYIDVLKGINFFFSVEDIKDVVEIFYKYYEFKLVGKNNIVFLMGYGNLDENYNVNKKYFDMEKVL